MSDQWRRISGVEVEDDGKVAAVWLGHDRLSDVVTLYDCCKFNAEVLAVIAEGLNVRGRWVPIAWNVKDDDFRLKLQSRGCNMVHDGMKETPQMAEMSSRDIEERMRTGRFKVDRRMAEWLAEFELFGKAGGKIPTSGYPLMAATRYAIGQLDLAKRLQQARKSKFNERRISMI
jgi:hypothetical protein